MKKDLRRRRVRVGPEAFTYVKKPRYQAITYMNGHGIQLGGPIGRNGDMVLRLRVRHGRHADTERPWLGTR